MPDLYTKKFIILPQNAIATAGSCFAQHIAVRLRAAGYSVVDVEPAPPGVDPSEARAAQYGVYSARFGNIYYVRQLLQLAREVLEGREPGEVVWEREGRYYDALRPSVMPGGYDSPEQVLAHRRSHLRAVRRLFETTDVFIFTMGLTEAWELVDDGTVFPTAPGTIAGDYDPARYALKNLNYQEIVSDFIAFRLLVKRVRPRMRFILTVSPVPLAATATEQHVLTATAYSKAVLRAAAGEIERRCRDVDYFPSYEIVTSNFIGNDAFGPSGRDVRPEAVERVMTYFFAQHPASTARPSEVETIGDVEEIFCEDALLEVFAE
ncbi:GSCFA domain-containing protein [Pseudarthrobacter sp. J75]|uniref:GSCFA domain-containing protein n=1 Tax=Pseudarthrobacter sp. J75 TaxID=3116486 RepID=UPI002E7FE232|nr:GSCFA domain-containing protein [Pseudarthrobacter sp. J75]MEE2528803.1 GSCFA domain-containing protein [Pseudarthrobacter sp. J75]